MLKERIQEIYEFTKSESPYRKANKGWINKDIFLDLRPSLDTLNPKEEAARVTLFWSPINTLLVNIFTILIISSILVFSSISFTKSRLDFNLFNTSLINDIVNVEDNNAFETTDLDGLDSINLENKQDLDANDQDSKNKINSLDDNQMNSDQKIITNKINKQESSIKDIESKKDNKILENKKSKSNFI